MESTIGSVPLPPLYPNQGFPISNTLLRGTGQLTWLSSKAGLISCSKPQPVTVSFQLKDFCDVGVNDLTSVLRVGFQLAFHAASPNDNNEWIANYVAPIGESQQDVNNAAFNDTKEMDLEAIERSLAVGPAKSHKDPYTIEMEVESLSFLLNIFQKNAVHFIPLSSLHSRISNSGKEDLYRYIGSSSLKRRQFIERRSYIFHIADNDVVFLQPSEVYMAVCILTGYLLSHGGVTTTEILHTFFNTSPLMPLALKEAIKNDRAMFMNFLTRHPFAFSLFPSGFYVSVRRNLPYFDYSTYIKKNFPACVYSRSINNVPIPAYVPFEHMNDNLGNIQSFHTPTTPVTPIFQEDQLMVSQKASRNGGWPNDIGYFNHHGGSNGMSGGMGGPVMPGPNMPMATGPKMPLVGGCPPQPPVGRNPNPMATVFGGGDMQIPKMSEFAKVDVSRRPNELNLMDLRNPAIIAQMMRRPLVDRSTQTDFMLDGINRNIPQTDRAVGSDSRCCCKCTCQWSQDQHRRQSSAESQQLARTHSQTNNRFADIGSEQLASLMRQRPVSVQDKPINMPAQRPLFGNHTSAGIVPPPTTTSTAAAGFAMNNAIESAVFGNMAKSTSGNEFDAFHDSFFNHTLSAFASNFMGNGGPMLNGNEFMSGLGMNSEMFPSSNNGSHNGASVIGQQRRSAPTSTESSESSALPMPIGVMNHGENSSASSSAGQKNSIEERESPTNSTNATKNTGTNGATANASGSHYDPFGNGFKLEIPSLSSLKL